MDSRIKVASSNSNSNNNSNSSSSSNSSSNSNRRVAELPILEPLLKRMVHSPQTLMARRVDRADLVGIVVGSAESKSQSQRSPEATHQETAGATPVRPTVRQPLGTKDRTDKEEVEGLVDRVVVDAPEEVLVAKRMRHRVLRYRGNTQ